MNEEKVTIQLATLVEQGRWTAKKLDQVEKEIKELRQDFDAFKYRALGICIGVGAVGGLLVKVAESVIK